MSIKDKLNALVHKDKQSTEISFADQMAMTIAESDMFPVVKIPETELMQYKKIPLASLSTLGMAFSQLSDNTRKIVQTTTKNIGTDQPIYIGLNPKNVSGVLQTNQFGTNGNIMRVNKQGKKVIAGRMSFKQIDGLSVTETNTTTLPLDPTMMVVAVAVMAIEQKLDRIQESVEEVLQFLNEDKQAGQRGRLKHLAEIAEDFKRDCINDSLLSQRNIEVQSIQTKAMENIEFYQTRINNILQNEKAVHGSNEAKQKVIDVSKDFAEYQLTCYTYGYCVFLDMMLRKDYNSNSIQSAVDRMISMNERYRALFDKCRSELLDYQSSAIETKIVDGIGIAVKGIGKAIGSIPKIRDGLADEKLIAAGDALNERNHNKLKNRLKPVEVFENSKIEPFVDSLKSVDVMYNKANAMITDGQYLYVLEG